MGYSLVEEEKDLLKRSLKQEYRPLGTVKEEEYYNLLSVSPLAGFADIRKAYLKVTVHVHVYKFAGCVVRLCFCLFKTQAQTGLLESTNRSHSSYCLAGCAYMSPR